VYDGFVLSVGETISEVGKYNPDVAQRLRDTYGDKLHVVHHKQPVQPVAWDAPEPIPMLNGVLLPAFVKAHGHDHEQPIIGIAKDEPLTSWLDHAVNPFTGFINKFKDQLTEELGCSPHYATYRMARLCDIYYGITACMVHHCNHNKYHVEEIAQVNELVGTTMIVAIGGQDRFYVQELLDQPHEPIERLERALAIPNLRYTQFCPGPDQLFSNSRKVLIPQKEWSRKHNTLFHIHSSEEPKTTRWFREQIEPGMTPVEYAESIGILDENTVLAHQVNCGPRDVEIIARHKTKVVHNPLANTILGSGMPPLIDMLKAGVSVAISTDGSGSADNQNILNAARLAAQYQKALHQDATLLPSQQLLEMITVVPNAMLRFNQGELSRGRQADWVLLALARPNLTPTRLDNVVENIIWSTDGSEIDTVVTRGRILKQNGQILPFPDGSTPTQIMHAIQILSERFAEYKQSAPQLKGTGAHQ
jgi:5-methylthioadenosine/S-adenosylhomocysteine deaminase